MKIKLIALVVFMVASNIYAFPWINDPPPYQHVVKIDDLPPINGDFPFIVTAKTQQQELNYYGVMDITTQELYNSYHILSGSGESRDDARLLLPPGWIEPEDLWGASYKYRHLYYYSPGCTDMFYPIYAGLPDSEYFAAGFGHVQPGYYMGIPMFVGYCVAVKIIDYIFRGLCLTGGSGPSLKSYAYFTDSTYSKLPDTVLISGDSPLYFKAQLLHQADSARATLWLSHTPESSVSVSMTKVESTYQWIGHIDNSRLLGLKSYAKALLRVNCTGFDSTDIDSCRDTVIVCLPKPDVKGMRWPADTTWRDTVFINHDSMKVAGDVPVFLVCKDDATGKEMNLKEKIDSVGYRYRSMWRSNTSQTDTMLWRRYPRIYPRDSSYVKWTNAYPTNPKTGLIKLINDSLYAIGGKLTIEARGALAHVDNINNVFKVNSDSITPQGDTIRHQILIDADPSNAEFIDSLGNDTVRAIAWKEWAGYGAHPWRNKYRPQYNHYWDTFTVNGYTCPRDTFLFKPIESTTGSNTATGIMQILRTVWEGQFNGTHEDGPVDIFNGHPFFCSWDSVAWNWKIFVHKGAYIINKYLPNKINLDTIQRTFPDSCPFAECDTFPSKKNKTDLIALGYNQGFPFMYRVKNDSLWGVYISRTKSPVPDYCTYVQEVRKYFYRKPW